MAITVPGQPAWEDRGVIAWTLPRRLTASLATATGSGESPREEQVEGMR